MKNNNIIRHGEVLLVPSKLPKGAELMKTTKKEIVAHSETGHHHVLTATKPFKVYTWKGGTYIEVPEMAELFHEKSGQDVHTSHKVAPMVYKISIKKQFDYFAGKLAAVRD